MNYFEYLKRRFRFYIISGIILSGAVFSLIIVERYNTYLLDTLGAIESISLKKISLKKYSEEIDLLERYFTHNFKMDITDENSEQLLFKAVDDLKADLKDATITIRTYEKNRQKKELPVEIMANMKNYKKIIEYVGYVESFRIPDYRIENISISRDPLGKVTLSIKGVFVVPSS